MMAATCQKTWDKATVWDKAPSLREDYCLIVV